MKKKLIPLVMILITLTSCNEDEIINQSDFNSKSSLEISNLYQEIIKIDDLNEQKLVISSFDTKTQYSLWQLKLDNFLANNELNKDQKEVITKLKENITIDNLNKRTTKKVQDVADALEFEVKQSFGNDLGHYLLSKFENSNQTIDKLSYQKPQNSGFKDQTIRACDCEENNECTRLTGVSLGPGGLGLSWEYGQCGGTCYVETYFFGLWESSNTGRCSY